MYTCGDVKDELTKGLSYGLLWKMGMGIGQENYCL